MDRVTRHPLQSWTGIPPIQLLTGPTEQPAQDPVWHQSHPFTSKAELTLSLCFPWAPRGPLTAQYPVVETVFAFWLQKLNKNSSLHSVEEVTDLCPGLLDLGPDLTETSRSLPATASKDGLSYRQ